MIRLKRFFILVLFVWASAATCLAQEADADHPLIEIPLYYAGINPEHAIGIFSLDMPMFFPGSKASSSEISISVTMGNTWHPKAWFYYPQLLTAEQAQVNRELYMTWRPIYFETIGAETKVKSFQSDGVLQHFRMAWLKSWKEKNSLVVNMNLHLLTGGSSPLNYLVSDNFIEDFHTRFAVDDNYGRRLFPFNKASLQFDDENGKSYRRDKGDLFTSVVDLHYYRQLINYKTRYSQSQLAAGLHLSVPLNKLHRYTIPGISAGARLNKLTGAKTSVTLAADAGLAFQTALKSGTTVKAIDHPLRQLYKLYVGGNIVLTPKDIFQFGLLQNYQSALMKGSKNDWGQVDYKEIGVSFLEEGDIWEGEEITQEFFLARTTPAALYFFSYKAFFVFGWLHKNHRFNMYIGEDFFYINNAPDFQLGFEYSFPLQLGK